MGTVEPIKPQAAKTRLEEAVEAARAEYAKAERSRDEAASAVAAAERVVADAEAAHAALQAAAIAGDDVTADELGLALHKIAGARSLVAIRASVVVAREAAMEAVLDKVVCALQSATQRAADAAGVHARALHAEMERMRGLFETALRRQTHLTTVSGSVARRRTAACDVSALDALLGRVSLAEYDAPV